MKLIDCFRKDSYFDTFYFVQGKNVVELKDNELVSYGIKQKRMFDDAYAHFSIDITPKFDINFDCFRAFGLRLGIDSYMESYPEWNNKFFPTSIRCESNGFWGIFISPLGKIIAVCSPSSIISWKNEYNKSFNDVGHRICKSIQKS